MIAGTWERLRSDGELRRGLARLVLAILAVQAVYWLAVRPLLGAPDLPDTLFEVSSVEAAQIATPDRAGIDAAQFEPAEFMFTGCCDPAYYAVRLTFDLDQRMPDGVGMTPSIQADNARVYLNGHLIVNDGAMALPQPTIERLRNIWFFSPDLLRQGTNTVEIVTVRATMPYTDVTEPRIGPWPDMKRAFGWREFQFGELSWIGISTCLVLALAALVLFLRGGRNPAWFWLAVLTSAWGLRLYLAFWAEFPLGGNGRVLVWSVTITLVALGWASFANEWGGRPIRWLRYALPALTAAKLGLNAVALYTYPSPEGYDTSSLIDLWGGVLLAGIAVLLLLRHALLFGLRHALETALFLLLAMLVGIEALQTLQLVSHVGGLEWTAPLIFVAFAASFLSRNIRLFRSMEEYNEQLATELAARETEIADAYAERQEVARQQALLTERQRIMRDMHDGMGGRLMSIAAQLKAQGSAAPPPAALADELMEALDELRLIVDSLDTAGDDLGMALGAFRARMEGKLAAAGIESEWTIDEHAAETTLSATAILDIYRIMQEACANMLRYSGADHFEVALRAREDGAVVLEMADNGIGLEGDADQTGGKGLANMRSRAALLGGQIAFAVNAPGLKISLLLPPAGTSSTPTQ